MWATWLRDRLHSTVFRASHSHQNPEVIAVMVIFSGLAQDGTAVSCDGGGAPELPLPGGTIKNWWVLGHESHCLRLYAHWWAHQVPMDSSASMVVETTLAKLSGQSKAKGHECGKGTCGGRKGDGWRGDEREQRKERSGMHYIHAWNCRRTSLINETVVLIILK